MDINKTMGYIGMILLIFLIVLVFRHKNHNFTDNSKLDFNEQNMQKYQDSPQYVKKKEQEFANKNYINNKTFKGDWALTVPEAKIDCINVDEMKGTKIIIDNKEFALTRNLTNLPFLPSSYWKDLPKDEIGGCAGATVNNECKVSLFDMMQYADNLCN